MNKLSRLLRSTRAATAIEYGLIIAMIFLAAVGAIAALGNSSGGMWDDVGTKSLAAMTGG